MMDFLVRETRLMVEGQLLFIRFGTCGGLQSSIPAGNVVVASEGSGFIYRDPDLVFDEACSFPYKTTSVSPSDTPLSQSLISSLTEHLGEGRVNGGLNVTADSFYSSQGRLDPEFEDRNGGLVERVLEVYPSGGSMEMESFQLLDIL